MKKWIIIAVSFCITFLLVLSALRPTQYDIKPGGTAPADIYAPREIVDEHTTNKRKDEAEAGLLEQYDIKEELTQESERALRDILDFASSQRATTPPNQKTKINEVDISALLRMDDATFSAFASLLLETQSALLEAGITEKAAAMAKARDTLSASTRQAGAGVSILEHTLRENKFYNAEKTEEARRALRDSVSPVIYKAGQVIVRKGDILSQSQFSVLSALGMVASDNQKLPVAGSMGAFVLLLASYAVLYLYMRRYAHECLHNDGLLLMIAIIFVLTMLLGSSGLAKSSSPYLLPIMAPAVLLAILVDLRFAITYHTVVSILYVLFFEGDIYCLSCFLLAGILAVFVFTRHGLRHTLVFSALLQSACQFLLYLGVGALEGLTLKAALLQGVYGFGAGAIGSVLVIGTLPFWEYAFDVTTPYKLLELCNPDQPLLKRLLTEAPGTYHHSLMVGNLAEAACEAIGGNPLLARAGAYYHDVGKLRRPQYFKENQYAENPHDKMNPTLSASIIISHVKDGMDLARQHRLPGAIRNMIATHHGTSLVAFFYHKAQIENEGESQEEKFRYGGPRPATREEAIIMLADSAEAAVRSLENKEESCIREMVHKILQGKLGDGQMRESGLSLRDMEMIESSFVHAFCGYFHSRVPYPETHKKEE